MKKKSSKDAMDAMESFRSVRKAEVPDGLLEKVMLRIAQQKNKVVRPVWVRAAAAMLVCWILTELYVVQTFTKARENPAEALVPVPDNMLYHE